MDMKGFEGGSWHMIWFSKSVIIELGNGYSGERRLQKSLPKPNLKAGEFVQEHILKMTRCWEVKSITGKFGLEINHKANLAKWLILDQPSELDIMQN